MIAAWLLGAAWGLVLAGPLVSRARRRRVAARASALRTPKGEPTRPLPRGCGLWLHRAWRRSVVGRVFGGWRARRHHHRADARLAGELPVTLDLLGVAVGAGCTPYVAVEVAARWAPPAMAERMSTVRHACGMGASLADALDHLGVDTPRLRPLADALLSSDRTGAPVGPALARLAAEERAGLRRQAEAHARTVPVRLLFPLVFLVLPAFGLLTVVPTLLADLARR